MATDVGAIVRKLSGFYDFGDKTVVAVGAGGGQLVGYARPTRRVIAVDQDPAALLRLTARLSTSGLEEKFTFLATDILDVDTSGDVVLFEFCLHEMPDPARALSHARNLAPDVVVIDHAPGSLWEWYAAEDAGLEAAWTAIDRHVIRRQESVETWQHFEDYAALVAKLSAQGPESMERIEPLRGETAIAIPMPYRMALL